MRRFLSLVLILAVCAAILPVQVLAAEDHFTLTEKEIAAVSALVGEDSIYHEGMGYSDTMTAYQKSCALRDLRNHELSAAKNSCKTFLNRDQEQSALTEEQSARLKAYDRRITQIDLMLDGWIFDLEQEVDAFGINRSALKNGTVTGNEAASAYRRIAQAGKRIRKLNEEIAQESPSALRAELSEISEDLKQLSEELVTEHKPLLKSSRDLSFDIVILRADQIGVEVHGPGMELIGGASVTLSSGDVTETVLSGSDGVAVFDATHFDMDDHDRIWAALLVEADGMRTYESKVLRVVGGEGIRVILEEDDGEPYVQYMTFRGVDVLHDTEMIDSTPLNDARQSFEIGIRTKPGRSGTFAFTYTDADTMTQHTIERTVEGGNGEVRTFDLSDTWCAKLAPEQEVQIAFSDGVGGESLVRKEAIKVREAVVKSPLKSLSAIQPAIGGIGATFRIPVGFPGVQEIQLSLNVPEEILSKVPVNFFVMPNGDFNLAVAFAVSKELSNQAEGNGWKTVNSKKASEMKLDYLMNRTNMTRIAQESTVKRGSKFPGWKSLGGTVSISFTLWLNGQFTKNDDLTGGAYFGKMDLFFSVAGDLTVSVKNPYVMVGPVPCTFGFDFTVGLLAGVDIPFTFTTDRANLLTFLSWKNFTFDKQGTDIVISPHAKIDLYAGVGIKGLFALYLRGYAGISVTYHIRPWAPDEVVTPVVQLTAGVQVVAELLVFTYRQTIWQKDWLFPDPNEKAKDAALAKGTGEDPETDEIRYVEASVQTVGSIENLSSLQTVQCGDDFYCFWQEEAEIDGITRSWLKCVRVDPNAEGNAAFTEVDLEDLGLAAFDGVIPSDPSVGVRAFCATALSDPGVIERGLKVIAIQVFFSGQPVPFTGSGTDTIASEWNQEIYYMYSTPKGHTGHFADRYDPVMFRFGPEDEEPSVTCCDLKLIPSSPGAFMYYTAATYMTSEDPCACTFSTDQYRFDYSDGIFSRGAYTPTGHTTAIDPARYGRIRQFAVTLRTHNLCEIYLLAEKADGSGNDLIVRSLYHGVETDVASFTGDLVSFRYVPADSGTIGSCVTVVGDPDEFGRNRMYVLGITADERNTKITASALRDMGVKISPACFDLVTIGDSRVLYYLEQTMPDNDRERNTYGLKAVYLAEGNDGQMFISAPFHLAVFDAADLDPDRGVADLKLFSDRYGFLQGFVTEKTDATDSAGNLLKYFTFLETLQADIRDVLVENVLVKPGEACNLLFTVMNTGNVPLSRILLSAYALKEGQPEKIRVANILVDLVDPESSQVILYDEDEVAVRTTGERAVSQYDSATEEGLDTYITEDAVYATSALMPDETHSYRAQFVVPQEFDPGTYRIYVSPSEISTSVLRSGSGYSAVSAWARTMTDLDAEVQTKGTDEDILTLTARVAEDRFPVALLSQGGSNQENVPVTLIVSGGSVLEKGDEDTDQDASLLAPFAKTTRADREEIVIDTADLSVTARLTNEAGEEYVHIVIRNESASPMTDVELKAAADGETTLLDRRLSGLSLGYRNTVSVDLPLKTLTGDSRPDEIVFTVSGEGNEENLSNNTDSVVLMDSLAIAEDPEDVFTVAGGSARFAVAARGGEQPYTYRWEYSRGGKNGPYEPVEGGNTRVLEGSDLPAEWNGYYFRCTVTDGSGKSVTSRAALLVVGRIPKTGDTENIPLLLAGLVCSGIVLLILLRGRRRRRVS